MLPVRIAGLSHGRHAIDAAPAPSDLDLDPADFRDLRVTGHFDLAATQVVVTFEVAGVARLTCDRTLAEFEQPVSGAFTVVYSSDADLVGDEEADDLRYLAPDTLEIDLAGPVRDTLLLALPMHPVAPGAEDLPLPTTFGAPETDSRWEGLLRFRADDEPSS